MMDLAFVQSLIQSLDQSGLDSIEIERGGTRIRLAKTPPSEAGTTSAGPSGLASTSLPLERDGFADARPVPSHEPPSQNSVLIDIVSPMVGTFYGAPAPAAASYVEMGASVSPGDTLCIIEAMKLMNELECEVSGVVREICVEDGEPVEFGQVLFRVSP
jgi:acetyl-CoA carboxylase biotin carboxyl carrier protein